MIFSSTKKEGLKKSLANIMFFYLEPIKEADKLRLGDEISNISLPSTSE